MVFGSEVDECTCIHHVLLQQACAIVSATEKRTPSNACTEE